MAGCSAFHAEPFHVQVPCGVTATISCCAGSPAIADGLTWGPLLKVLGLDHEEPVHVVMLPEQQMTVRGAGMLVGIGTGTATGGTAAGPTGPGTGDAVPAFAAAAGMGVSGHGAAIAGDTGAPQA